MKRANVLRLMCVLGLIGSPVLAQGAPATPTAAKATAPAKSAAKPVKKSAKGTSKSSRATAQKASKSTTVASKPANTAGPRRLEDIHIEGEVPVPQVLFITARDQRRFLESHHELYLRTSRELGESTPLPARVVLTPAPGAPGTPAVTPATPAATKDAR
jgi:hypothetical protein